jgi:hypothetical protein
MCQESGFFVRVSKRCCPVCAFLLKLLKPLGGGSFLITGEHSRVMACTLPEWLLEDIIKQVVNEFVGRLRKELVKLQLTTAVLHQSRAHTTESVRLSLDSVVERPQDFDGPSAVGELSNQITLT